MSTINYEMVYKLSGLRIDTKENIVNSLVWKAQEEGERQYEMLCAEISKVLGHEEFEITNISCVAKGVSHHVWVKRYETASSIKSLERDSGKKVCIFCGNDDFDI